MWIVHKIENRGGNLTAFARSSDGGEFPAWATGELLAAIARQLPAVTRRVRGTVRQLHDHERESELAQLSNSAGICQRCAEGATVGQRLTFSRVRGAIQELATDVSFSAIEFPGIGWQGDSSVDVHLVIPGGQ